MVKEMQERKVIVGLEIFLQRVIMIKKLFGRCLPVYTRIYYTIESFFFLSIRIGILIILLIPPCHVSRSTIKRP